METKIFKRMSSGLHTLIISLITLFAIIAGTSTLALPPMNMPYGVTPISHEIYHLHMTIFAICCVIGVGVFGTMIYALIYYRKSRGAVSAQFHEHMGVEILWTAIPFIILIVMAVPATKVLIDIHNTAKPDINIKITGYQWRWGYDYLDQNIHFMSNLSTPLAQQGNTSAKGKNYLLETDNDVIVPIHKKVRFLITSNDVVHSWWVPDLGIKQDAIPGYINETWAYIDKPGFYRGQCGELCGARHGFMPIVVHAVSQKEFSSWVNKQHHKNFKLAAAAAQPKTLSHDELMAAGKKIYESVCAVCHKPGGEGMPPTFPAIKGGPISTGPIAAHINIVLHGKKGTAMAPFASQYGDEEIASVITYERTAFGNDAINKQKGNPTTAQPADVRKLRQHAA